MVGNRKGLGERVHVFYLCAAAYFAIGLVAAVKAPGRARRPGLRGQIAVTADVLKSGLLWPERWRARIELF
jgi:hypothetical protein